MASRQDARAPPQPENDMSMFNKVTKTFQWGQHSVTLETGEIARQASGAVVVNMEDTVILATVVAAKTAKPGQDFFPLTVDYIEKTYAAGKIPGSFFKREGRPSELETLTSRLIDRPIRPLFPDGFFNDQYVLNPGKTDLTQSQLDLVVAGTEAAVLMVESEANQLSEEVMLGAVVYGHTQQQAAISMIHELVEAGGKPLWDWQPAAKNERMIAQITG